MYSIRAGRTANCNVITPTQIPKLWNQNHDSFLTYRFFTEWVLYHCVVLKALSRRSAASPGETSPCATLRSISGSAARTSGCSWKWRRAFSWIRLHSQTFCCSRLRVWSSPLDNTASRYCSMMSQSSGTPCPVWEETRTTWPWRHRERERERESHTDAITWTLRKRWFYQGFFGCIVLHIIFNGFSSWRTL